MADPDIARKATEALWDPAHPLARVFAEAPIGMALISVEHGREGERLAVNHALCEMTGYEEVELLSMRLGDLGHPDDARVGAEERGRLLSGELEAFEIERRCVRKDEKLVVLRSNLALVRDADGAPLYAIAQVRDVTAERAAESRLRSSEERFRRLAESNDDAIYLMRLGPQRRYEYVSPAIEKLSGRAPDEFYEDPDLLWRIVHPDDRPLLEAVKAPFGRPVVTRWIRRDASVIWAEQRVVPIIEDGKITAIQGIVRDVTETLKRREELSFQSRLLDELDAGVLATDDEGRITLWNGAAERMYGWSKDEVMGRPGTEIPELKLPDETLEAIRDATADGGSWEGEVDGRNRNGRAFPTQMRIRSILRPDGSIEGRLVVAWDITESKYATHRLRRQAAQQAAVAELGERALEGVPPQELMEHAVRLVRETLGVEHACALEHEPAAARLTTRASDGWGGLEATVPTESDSLSARALRTGGPVRVDDAQADDRARTSGAWAGLLSGVSVPIRGKGRPFGVLSAFSGGARAFRDDDMNFVVSTANILADAIERHRVEEQLAHQGLHDPLTGLPNRVLFMDRLRHALDVAERDSSALGVIFADLDHFKLVNDGLGHSAGDELLVAVAPRLQEALRPFDTVARFGGDEFVVLCERVDKQDLRVIAERIARALSAPVHLAGADHHITASIGMAISSDTGPDAADTILRDADAAMYRAKEAGRARIETFDEDMRKQAVGRLRMESELRRAIERNELRVHYQPLVSLDGSYTPLAFEALVRWQHPDRGLIQPGDFVAIAEETGLVVELGRWTSRRIISQLADWRREWPGIRLHVSINASARELADWSYPARLEKTLAEYGVPPENIAVEITESLLVDNSDVPMRALRRLKALGVKLALDDFGTGYSSLSYLDRFPIDSLKIDRSFVSGAGADQSLGSVVQAIIGMAKALKIQVIAEGIETPEQAAWLQELGCRYGQGFLFAKPAPAEELDAVLQRVPRVAPTT
jgi:diguanylate cyclase (GGDEF)-like protein/PAS domain S-box-containing protein